eukprot:TRINITY_DN32337_c0_g1_i1.p1 TRINITY_DN32337_c0_g1~~TRINITY_DN32337_c0_g1_i1.p1  ORF type:complete len:200 (+),score=57.13 TRINITY_DN32337_c0_g1_i1:190-789(+)
MAAEDENGTPLNEVCNQVIESFQDPKFVAKVEDFVNLHIDAFAVTLTDGSHPLEWTTYFRKYKAMYEAELQRALDRSGTEVTAFMDYMQQCNDHYGTDAGFQQVMTALTACLEYDAFLQVMFHAVRENWVPEGDAPAPPPAAEGAPAMQVHEVDVIIPEGYAPGMVMGVEYLGLTHQVTIPDGCEPGTTIRCNLSVPGV